MVMISRKRKRRLKTLSMFSKGGDNSVAVNFSPCGGENCSKQCKVPCYGIPLEKMRANSLGIRLARHLEMGAEEVCKRSLAELKRNLEEGQCIDFFRLSAFGSVPKRPTKGFIHELRKLLRFCRRHAIKVHFPVEGSRKKARYEREVGDLVVVRESCQSELDFLQSRDPASFVVGSYSQSRRERLAAASKMAKQVREWSGRPTAVCPGIKNAWLGTAKTTCDGCTICSGKMHVIFPLH